MGRVIKEKKHSIVIRGKFNPAIFQPAWFSAKKLLNESTIENAKNLFINNLHVEFNIEWASILVEPDLMLVSTADESHEAQLRDLIVGAFKFLGETPIIALGINREVYFEVESLEKWNSIGHMLVPKEVIWDKVLKSPKTASVVVSGNHEESEVGIITVKIEPSAQYRHSIYVNINDHYPVIKNQEQDANGMQLSEILSTEWEKSTINSNKIIKTLIEKL